MASSWWYCLNHNRVEDENGCAHADRLGPYGSADEAAGALEAARQRTAAQDARDQAENDWGRPPARG